MLKQALRFTVLPIFITIKIVLKKLQNYMKKQSVKVSKRQTLISCSGKVLNDQSNEKLALPYLQRATELAPDDLEIRLSYGIVLANLELFKEAGNEFRFIIEQDDENADAHYNLGFLYAVSTEQKQDALNHLEKAFTIDPEHVQARYIYDMIKLGEEGK